MGPGKFAHQVSSEIEAITAIMGAGFVGKRSMTATAGPGHWRSWKRGAGP